MAKKDITQELDLDEDIKMDENFYKEIYKDIMILLKAKVLSGTIDIKEINVIFAEIKRLEIAVQEDDVEVITSFVKAVRSGNVVDLPFDNPKAINQ